MFSTIVNNPRVDSNDYVLFVKGNYEDLGPNLTFNEASSESFKNLMNIYKNNSNSVEIYAKRILSYNEVIEYQKACDLLAKSHYFIDKSKYEAIQKEMEQDLFYIGCVGYEQKLRPNLENFIKKAQLSNVNISILTQHKAVNCMSICNRLNLMNDKNLKNYWHLHMNDLSTSFAGVSNILEDIYQNILRCYKNKDSKKIPEIDINDPQSLKEF